MHLQNATVLVTGGTSGIGRGVARVLTQAGAKVAVTGRDDARLLEVARELGVLAIKADVTSETDVDRTYAEVLGAFGHLDVLVNNAGAGSFAPLVDMSLDDFESIMCTNVTGAMLMARAAARHFVKRRSGNIVNIGSTAALRGMTECWRAELRPSNVRVILVNPSEVMTEFAAHAGLPQRTAPDNPTKLRVDEIAHAVRTSLEMDDRGFVTELTVFATNPKD